MTKPSMQNSRSHEEDTDRLTAKGRHELADSDFGIPRKREFPLPDAQHVRAAESRFHFAPEEDKPELARRILAKAREFGVNVESHTVLEWASR